MSNRNIIINELREISSTVANLPSVHPYHVPPTYFEDLAPRILSFIKEIETEEGLTRFLIEVSRKNPFHVPAGYFEGLADSIINHIKANEAVSPREELKALSPLLENLDKKLPFTMPERYFEDLSQDVMAGVNAIDFVKQEVETFSPLINAAKNTNVYDVPEGYFDALAGNILQKAKSHQKAKILKFGLIKRVNRYAVAAVVAGAITIGGWLFFHDNSSTKSTSDITEIQKVSDAEIDDYLENNSLSMPESNSTASVDMKEEDVKELLADVPDEELQQYVDQHSVTKDLFNN